ncbi:MAG: hypothetical protein UY17_C0014G0003 [Candidatus Beckwithbacteria bacterium GW2011_GWC2_47_9]|uniref:N-acetyltransferase domain-containing protein n=1 Tax=Candidatus Beckwithbacteria bacterium GW2011_GWC2_47_9 TaxID=1618373 RepID=A0A0G1WZB6_9BACT|nr:MAG: hypothetical protein UY17_C0014G0003 [Candidatus Beckwithbacteria bacterium GW2011_GWC2_47_9]
MSKIAIDQVVVRPFIIADYPQVKEILTVGGLFYEPMDSLDKFEAKITRDPKSIFVAVAEDKVVGTVSVMEDGRMPFIFRLAVAQEFRKIGIGSKLMGIAEQELFDRDYKEIHILVEAENNDLQNYYEKIGYDKGNIYRWMAKER